MELGLAPGLQCQAQEQAGAAGSEGQDWEQESQAEGQGKGGFCRARQAGGWGEAVRTARSTKFILGSKHQLQKLTAEPREEGSPGSVVSNSLQPHGR